MLRRAKFGRNRSSRFGDMEWPYILMHRAIRAIRDRAIRAYPLALEKKPSLTLSCGLGFGFR